MSKHIAPFAEYRRMQDDLAAVETALAGAARGPMAETIKAELRKMRERVREIRHAHDRASLEALVADHRIDEGRKAWARQALVAITPA